MNPPLGSLRRHSKLRYASTLAAVAVAVPAGAGASHAAPRVSTIAFASSRNHVAMPYAFDAAEIWLMDGDGTNRRRVTNNDVYDSFPTLSPDGRGKVLFDSNRKRTPQEPLNTSDIFLMNNDGSAQTFVVRGASGTWGPAGDAIAFHASASGTAVPLKGDPGAPTSDSDIFVLKLADAPARTNITNSPGEIDDDPDWFGDKIVFTKHPIADNAQNSIHAEIYVINADGSGAPARLTNNLYEERAPSWSPDGSRIAFMCRIGTGTTFEICVMNADGTAMNRLTVNAGLDATPTWSPDGQQIVFTEAVTAPGDWQLFVINADGTGKQQLTYPNAPGDISAFASWGDVDATPPLTTASLAPAPVNGWYVNPIVTLTADDGSEGTGVATTEYAVDGAGFVSYAAPFQVIGDGDHTLEYRSTDAAANVEATQSLGFRIDATLPVTNVTGVTDGGLYTLAFVPTATCSSTDTVSGIAFAATPSTTGGTVNGVGDFTVTCSGASDNAGNAGADATVGYHVNYGGLSGFLQPINPDGSSVFSGRIVPGKFRLAGDEFFGFVTSGWTMTRLSVPCDGSTVAVEETDIESVTATGFRYDAFADQYIYSADFRGVDGGTCWKLRATLDSGQSFDSAAFRLR